MTMSDLRLDFSDTMASLASLQGEMEVVQEILEGRIEELEDEVTRLKGEIKDYEQGDD